MAELSTENLLFWLEVCPRPLRVPPRPHTTKAENSPHVHVPPLVDLVSWRVQVQEYSEIKAAQYRAFSAKKIYRKYIADGAPMMLGVEDVHI